MAFSFERITSLPANALRRSAFGKWRSRSSAVGVRINCVVPGLFDTPIYGTGPTSEAFKDKLKRDVVFPSRLGHADELATMIMELLTNSYMNGETVRVDGAARLQPK